MHAQQLNRPGYIPEENTYSSHFYYVFTTFPECMRIGEYFPWTYLDMSKGLLRVFGGLLGTSLFSKFPFTVPDLLMNLLSWRVSQICDQVMMLFSYLSLLQHSVFKTKTSLVRLNHLYKLTRKHYLAQDSLVADVGS